MEINYLKNKKVVLLEQYVKALDFENYNRARLLKIKLQFLDELIREFKTKNEELKV